MKKLQLTIFYVLFILIYSSCQFDKTVELNIEKAFDKFNQEEYEEAIKHFDKLIENHPKDHISMTYKARSLFNMDKGKEALKLINKVIEINPKYSEAYGYRAVMSHQSGNYDVEQVLKDVDIALQSDPKEPYFIKIKSMVLFDKEDYTSAIKEYDKILNLDSTNYYARVMRGSSHKKLQKNKLALKDYEMAIKLDPSKSLVYEERAFLFLELKDFESAVEDFDKILKLKNGIENNYNVKAFTLNNRGFAKFKSGSLENGLVDINESIKLYPENSYAYKNRALIFLVQNKKKDACTDLAKSKQLGYENKYGEEVNELLKTHCEKE